MMSQHDAPRSTAETTGSWELLDFDQRMATASTWEGIESALLAIPERASSPNAIATLVAPNGDTLSIGIASPLDGDNPGLDRPLACVEFNQASQDPPYLVVIGDPSLTAEDGGVVVFRFEGQWTEVLRRNCVTVDVMLQIAKHFFLTGTLPDWIDWEQV
jgi:Immunity protein Imm1